MGHTTTSERKKDHIELAFQSVVEKQDPRFYYEPVFNGHPSNDLEPQSFLGKLMKAPIWVSSMTGGTKEAGLINQNLARACNEFGMGMGLGSCRIILEDDEYLKDFQLRDVIGEAPLFANLGIAQIEDLQERGREDLIKELLSKTETDGLIVHINPLQEWLQPEGDRYKVSPLETIGKLLEMDLKVIVKEVGQGFGPESLKALMQLPLAAIDFGAHGGTNFSKLEMFRRPEIEHAAYDAVARWGHSAAEMVEFYNAIAEGAQETNQKADLIISGGVKSFVDGFYLTQKVNANAVYGQASAFLKHARGDYQDLRDYVEMQVEGYKLALNFLRIRE